MTPPAHKPEDCDQILEDAYRMGKTDATLNCNDHETLMPKMKAQLNRIIEEAKVAEYEYLIEHKGLSGEAFITLFKNRISGLRNSQKDRQ